MIGVRLSMTIGKARDGWNILNLVNFPFVMNEETISRKRDDDIMFNPIDSNFPFARADREHFAAEMQAQSSFHSGQKHLVPAVADFEKFPHQFRHSPSWA